jgi:hypothetical protein
MNRNESSVAKPESCGVGEAAIVPGASKSQLLFRLITDAIAGFGNVTKAKSLMAIGWALFPPNPLMV